ALRLPMGNTHARDGALRRDAAHSLRAGLPSLEAQRAPRALAHRYVAVPSAAAAGRSAQLALRASRPKSRPFPAISLLKPSETRSSPPEHKKSVTLTAESTA